MGSVPRTKKGTDVKNVARVHFFKTRMKKKNH